MKNLAVALIRAYQRHLSPRKGYGCAYRLVHGRGSGCSGVGLRLVRRYGVWHGLRLLRARLHRCAQAAQQLHRRAPLAQRGDCDLGGCDACDGIDADDCNKRGSCNQRASCVTDVLGDACDCGGNDDKRRKRRKSRARRVAEALLALALLLLALWLLHRFVLPVQSWLPFLASLAK